MPFCDRDLNVSGSAKLPDAAFAPVKTRFQDKVPFLWPYTVFSCASLLLFAAPAVSAQQQTAALRSTGNDLPEAPRPQTDQQSSVGQIPATGSASISGVVLDPSGASVAGAQVSLTNNDGSQTGTLTSGTNGEFTFAKLPPGSYLVIVNAKNLAIFTSEQVAITAGQTYAMPAITMSMATSNTDVVVRPTEVIAAEQIKAEEKQRLIGFIPNYYVSYNYNAAPLTTKQKFSLATHDTLDWTSYVGVSITAGIEQANNSYAGYGQGAAGYAKRWAAQFGDGRISDYLSHAVFPSLFHQDPRYFYQGTGSKKSRLYHAVDSAFVARSDSGHLMPNYSYLLADMCAGALSNTYYPHADRGLNLVFTNAFIGIAGRAGSSVLEEFIGKHITKNAKGSGKP